MARRRRDDEQDDDSFDDESAHPRRTERSRPSPLTLITLTSGASLFVLGAIITFFFWVVYEVPQFDMLRFLNTK